MKLITAIIKPFKLDDVTEALRDLDIAGVTTSEVTGFGRQGGHAETFRGAEYRIDFLPKVHIEIVVPDDQAAAAVAAVRDGAATGKIGDGKIWVCDVERVVRVRTSQEGDDALI